MTDIFTAVVELLRANPAMIGLWTAIVWLATLYLLALGVGAFLAPEKTRKFLGGFASTPLINSTEAMLRFIAGVAFVGASPDLRFSGAFQIFGVFLALSAIMIGLAPGPHRKYARWAVPFSLKLLPIVGISSFLLAGFLAYCLL